MRTTVILFFALGIAYPSVFSEQCAVAAEATSQAESDPNAVYFYSDVMPLLSRLGCNQTSCHGAAKGKGGFRLSMFAGAPDYDYGAVTREAAGRRVNTAEPSASLLLLKATATIPHGGQKRIEVGSAQFNTLAAWIAQGTPWRDENAPQLISIKVEPAEKVLRKGESQQLRALAVFADNSQKDVTGTALYSSADEALAAASETGSVNANGFGETWIVVNYMRRFAAVRITVPQPLTTPFPDIAPNNKIDELVFAKLQTLGIPPSDVCSEHEFLRRVYLDATGTLPPVEEARAFLANPDPQKRSKLIDKLLASEEFGDYWALKWSDLFRMKSELPSNLWPNAVQAYHVWVKHSIAQNKPYDQFVRELLTSTGSNFRVPPTNFYRAMLQRTPQNLGESAALVFMGVRIGCARCHAHPSENWTLDDNVGLAAFFAQVQYKSTREWKEEIVYLSPTRRISHPQTLVAVDLKFPGGQVVDLAAPENAAREAEATAASAKTAASRAAAAQAAATQAAATKREQATAAKKKLDDLVASEPKPSEASVAAATQAHQAAETAAKEAETAAANAKVEADNAAVALEAAAADAAAKRKLADEKNAEDHRVKFADWLTSPENPWFTKNIVNRTWFWLFGRGIVHEADDLRSTNLPENAELLAYLEQELISQKFDLKHIYRLILNSKVYQLSFRTNEWNQNDVAHFSHRNVKRLDAETLLDGIGQVTGQWDVFRSIIPEPYVVMPTGFRATHLADGSIGVPFLEMFGRPPRDTAYEGDRDSQLYLRQTLHLLNSSDIQNKITASPRLQRLMNEKTNDREIVDDLYLATLSRTPTDEDAKKILDYVASKSDPALVQPQANLKAAEEALGAAEASLATARTEAEAAANALKQAQEAAGNAKAAAPKAAATQAEAQKAATAKRQQANAEKKRLDELVQKQQKPAEAKLAAAVKALSDATKAKAPADKLAAAEAQKKAAEQAVTDIKNQVAAAAKSFETADQAAKQAEATAAAAKAENDKAKAAQAAADKAVADASRVAKEAKAKLDKLVAEEKAAKSRLDAANKGLTAAMNTYRQLKSQAFQDAIWALLNTKEFLFNH